MTRIAIDREIQSIINELEQARLERLKGRNKEEREKITPDTGSTRRDTIDLFLNEIV
jgi:hypothetical protein